MKRSFRKFSRDLKQHTRSISMKTHPMTLAVLAFAHFSGLAAASEEKELSAKQVPRAVHEAFQKAYPAAKETKYSERTTDGKIVYEVEFEDRGRKLEATYGAEGALIETEEEIKPTELPEPVVSAIKKAHPGATVKEAEKVFNPKGTVSGYEVELADGKKRLELKLDANGTIVKTETDTDEED
ncbi:PepSY-like domain-containing protein [Methylococcus capsulatus]|uniref:PepSY-like domain-containing protein n=1 Tax=Methylococcus capsulatus TaxID=414 RepID=UPI002017B3DD|nr:PepSY-like domain-containing protein [Methylococcus capsulatus]UQN12448.1 PepSY-like domain-containing protein [Methylococcus capsulatus]